jgi:hypothetical protein
VQCKNYLSRSDRKSKQSWDGKRLVKDKPMKALREKADFEGVGGAANLQAAISANEPLFTETCGGLR